MWNDISTGTQFLILFIITITAEKVVARTTTDGNPTILNPLLKEASEYEEATTERVIKNPTLDDDFVIPNPLLKKATEDETRTERVIKNPSHSIYTNTKLIVNRPGENNLSYEKEVSDTDMYLLTAIEKLSYRLDAMEKRLRRTEELIYHVMEGSNIKRQDPCPANFTRVARNCYHFSERQFNWKSAASMCKSLGANLIEIESKDEFMEVVTYIQATAHLRGIEYWTGGLNPGLLWIWSNSARPVLPKKTSDRPGETVTGNGRCLNLALNSAKLYQYRGIDCSRRINYICEHEENATLRALIRIHKGVMEGLPEVNV